MTTMNGNLYRNFSTPGYDNTATIFPEQLFQDYIGLVSPKETDIPASAVQEHVNAIKALVSDVRADYNIATMRIKEGPKDIAPLFNPNPLQDFYNTWGMAMAYREWCTIICDEVPPSRIGRFDTSGRRWLPPQEERLNASLNPKEHGIEATETVKAFVHPIRPITTPLVLMVDDMSEPP